MEKRLLMPHGQNTVYVIYRLLSGNGSCGWSCAPRYISVRTRRRSARCASTYYRLTVVEDQFEIPGARTCPCCG